MPTQALTSAFLAELAQRVPASGSVSYFDAELKGLVLEHRASGGATFYFRYRDNHAKVRLLRLGRVGEVELESVRARAHRLRQTWKEGGDPGLEKRRFAQAPTLATFVADRYLPYAKAHKRSWDTDAIMLNNHVLPPFGEWRMHRLGRAEVVEWHQGLLAKGYAPGTCNRALVLLKFVYNCAIRWEVLAPEVNPCKGVALLPDHGARERYLTPEEVRRLFDELDSNRNVQVAQVIRLLLYTGARKREILDLRWEEIDWVRQVILIPAWRSKSKRAHAIPLSDAAVALLQQLPRHGELPWVFVNPKTGKPPVSIFRAWDSIRKQVGLQDVRLHDLRHSYASFLVNAGRSLYEVQKILGHHDPKVTMRYAHLSPQAMREAANTVAAAMGR
ncbi:tyrosine-type recombinase/integrase [Lamprobacter modestohalophilus]|uniref:tyrosine-type recombinase/integrase n=1 Tax=Lamprobacter modestohalophilus TaxID=1064514 RepID=UPI002ADEB657|nr:tyrosine-type recombinase/integrase [Lamprobacter modestohalophilus]MEA1052671.1 tyrosine-type recombinase/integrase [Lamprobacter modestohalophilus]